MRLVTRYITIGAIAACWVWLIATNWSQLSTYPWQSLGWSVTLAILAWCVYYVFMAFGWTLTARRSGASLPFIPGCWMWASSMPARYVPGNIWHVAGRAYLANQYHVPTEVTLLSSTIEQVLTVAGELVVFIVLLPFWPGLPTTAELLPLLLVPIGLISLHPRIIGKLLYLANRILHRPLAVVPLDYGKMLWLMAWYTLTALINGLAFLLFANVIGIASPDNWPILLSGYLLARAVGFLSLLTPAGIGVREATLVAILAPTITLPAATMAALGARVFSTIAEGLTLVVLNLAFLKQNRSQPISTPENP